MKNLAVKITIQVLTGIFLLGMTPQISYGQWASASLTTYPKRVKNVKSIDHLKKGILVIRLESKTNNIAKLTQTINSDKVDDKMKRQLRRQKAELIAERDKFNTDLMGAFYEGYDFSEFVFMMDTSAVHLLDGATDGIFLDKEGNIDPSISIEGSRPFILRIGRLTSENTTGIEALIVSDEKLNDLQRPFPYYVNLNHRLKLKAIFSKKVSMRRSGVELVNDVQKKFSEFHQYYENTLAKEENNN